MPAHEADAAMAGARRVRLLLEEPPPSGAPPPQGSHMSGGAGVGFALAGLGAGLATLFIVLLLWCCQLAARWRRRREGDALRDAREGGGAPPPPPEVFEFSVAGGEAGGALPAAAGARYGHGHAAREATRKPPRVPVVVAQPDESLEVAFVAEGGGAGAAGAAGGGVELAPAAAPRRARSLPPVGETAVRLYEAAPARAGGALPPPGRALAAGALF
jgi:hypothetical protein